ncbi:MAG: YqjF family protein [Gemmatimonadaceae bacterium]
MAQRWNDLLFMHWPVAPEAIRPHIPAGVELDLREGQAWLSITPFYLSHMRLRGAPPLPWLSEFLELNVRSYVVRDGKPGVFFFSLDAGKSLPVIGARLLYHLPYFRANMRIMHEREGIRYKSRRSHPGAQGAELDVTYAPNGTVRTNAPGSLEHWLTERYCLYDVDGSDRLYRTEIHHRPWPLHDARVTIRRNTMAAASGLSVPDMAPRAEFAHCLDVVVWTPERVR